jgi:non-ribosomal peptide synthase protein (TIGR01720 family)
MTEHLQRELEALTPEQRELLSLRLGRPHREPRPLVDPPSRPGAGAPSGAERLPLSFTQEQLWFLDRLAPGTAVYNVPLALRLTGPLDRDALRRAVAAVVARQSALRTVITAEGDGQPRQVVRDQLRVPMPVVDLRVLAPAERGPAADRAATQHAGISFDLGAGPLLAVRLLILADDEHRLLVTAHHIIFDAWSAGIFAADLAAYYGGFAAGEPVTLPALTTRFADQVARRRTPAAVRALETHLGYWRTRLAGAPPVSALPPDLPRPAVQTHRGGSRTFRLAAGLLGELVALASRTGVTRNAVLLAGVAALLRQASGQTDLLLGMPAAGRPYLELEPLIGCFANMLVLRVDLSGGPTGRELMTRVHRAISEAYAHQDAPYARVVEEVAPPRDPSINPLFQALVTFSEAGAPDRSAAGVRFQPLATSNGLTDFDLFLSLTWQGKEMEVVVDYNADLYLEDTVDHLAGWLPAILADLAAHPDQPIGTLSSLRRHTVAVTATFTVDPVREPLEFWLRFLRVPADVALVGYAQVVQHLLTGGEAEHAGTVCLLRWEDWLRHAEPRAGPHGAAELLDTAVRDLAAAVSGYRARRQTPLVLVVCPASPRYAHPGWAERFARLDDQLALLSQRVPGVSVVWADDHAGRYPVPEPFDPGADQLGHVPYTGEYFAALGTIVARALHQVAGQRPRKVLLDPRRLGDPGRLAALLPHEVLAGPSGGLADQLTELVTSGQVTPEECLALDPDPAVVAAVRDRHPRAPALVVPDRWEELPPFLAHLWPLDPMPAAPVPGGPAGWFPPVTAERWAYLVEHLADPAAVAERVAHPVRRSAGPEFVPPRTETERRLVELWRRVLRVDRLGVTSDFFALGGHSLLATQLLSRVQAELGQEVSLHTLFTHPTVAQLAGVLAAAAGPAPEPLLPRPRGAPAVASSTQERLWALAQLDDQSVAHNTTFAAILHGRLDAAALRWGIGEIVRRHEVLRTSYVERRGRPVPVVHAEVDWWLGGTDLSGQPAVDQEAAVREWIREHAAHPYDLAGGPLLVVRLHRLAADEHCLLVGMHHIVCDNTSWNLLLAELAELYAATVEGRAAELAPLPLQFPDFAYHQRDWLDGEEVRPHLKYWSDRLKDAPARLELPAGHQHPAARSEAAGYHRGTVPAGVGAAVRDFARTNEVTPFAVLLAGFGLLLRRDSGQSDLVVGVPTAGRDRPELASLIGCFTNLLPVRVDLAGRRSFRQLVRRVHRTALAAYQHQDLPLATIVEALRLRRDPGHHPLFQCVLNVIDLPNQVPALPGLRLTTPDVPAAGVEFDLFLSLLWEGDTLQADLSYRADLFDSGWAARLLAGLQEVLSAGLARPDEPVGVARTRPPELRPAEAPRYPVALAASFPAGAVVSTLEFWSELLGLPGPVSGPPTRQVLRPLLDPGGGLGTLARGLNAVLLRWEDWLAGAESLPAVVTRVELALADLCTAVASFCARSAAPLLLVECPASPRYAAAPLAAPLVEATHRLRRYCARYPRVEVVSIDAWVRRYSVNQAYTPAEGQLAYTPELLTVVGTVLAREVGRRWWAPIRSVVIDPGQRSGSGGRDRSIRDQARCGRRVMIGTPPDTPVLAALVEARAVELAGDQPADLSGALSVGPDHELDQLWALDPPVGGPPDQGGRPAPVELLAEIAAELPDAASIRTAVELGYRRATERAAAAPRTEPERALAAIWSELLRVPQVGIHDDFFALGGDSLLAMRVVSAAAREGVAISPRDLVRQPTIAQLCAGAGDPPAVDAEQGLVEGGMPLTAAQEWFFATLAPTMARPGHFNHPYYLELREPVPVDQLAAAIERLAAHHDALRLRFDRDPATGRWRQSYAPLPAAVPFGSHDLSAVLAADREEAVAALAARAQAQLDLTAGPTVRVVHFHLGPGGRDRLLVVAHHLVVDAVSRGILLEDLESLCHQIALPAKTTSYRAWAERLSGYANGAELLEELPFWLAQAGGPADPIPPDRPGGPVTLGTLDSVTEALTGAETVALHGAARRLGTGVRDLLVWAVARAVAERTGAADCPIATTGHGREDLFDGVDVTRTAGWFQVLYPVRLQLTGSGPLADSAIEVIRQLRTVPRNGIGYGLLRFSRDEPELRARLSARPQPRIAVNYMGGFGFDELPQAGELFEVCTAGFGPAEDPDGHWPFPLDVVGSLIGDRLQIDLSYGTTVYQRQTARELCAAITARLRGLTDSLAEAGHPS